MRILLSNDDGIEAEGLAILERAARLLSDDVWVVAPDGNRSGYGHAFTLGRSFSIQRVASQRFRCTGTPVDCILAAVHWVFHDDERPDLVLSGINHGRNVAEDVSYSGTMAVAREATLNGMPGIAFSRPRDGDPFDEDACRWLADQIERMWETREAWADDTHWLSVNLPRTVPAMMAPARIGRDKVGKHVIIHRADDDFAEIQPLSDRDYCTTPGDENSLIDSGIASITRLSWLGYGDVPPSVFSHIESRNEAKLSTTE
jgi:5'-nucleotidase